MENSCKNCKHFVQHYLINKFQNISPANCGFCKAKKLTEKERKQFPFSKSCELWESNEQIKEERKRELKKDIQEIVFRLNEILQILKAD